MTILENQQVAYNLKLFKLIGLYHVLNPETKRIFNYFNPYRLIFVLLYAYAQCVLFFGSLSFFVETEGKLDEFDTILLLAVYIYNWSVLLMIYAILYKSKSIWTILNVTRIQFLESLHCRSNSGALKKCRDKLVHITNFIFSISIFTAIFWLVYPLVINSDMYKEKNENTTIHRYQNIVNLRYPVSISFYNRYFYVFYNSENIILVCSTLNALIDVFFASLYYIFTFQYKILGHAFGNIGHGE